MRDWVVASGLVEGPEGLLLVQNRRRDGRLDWTPPGGVVEVADGESVLDGLTREVREETGICVTGWEGPVYDVEAEAVEMGWRLRVEAFVASAWEGELHVEDPDGIVVDARFVPLDDCVGRLEGALLSVLEPMAAWLDERHASLRSYRYRVEGAAPAVRVVRLGDPPVVP